MSDLPGSEYDESTSGTFFDAMTSDPSEEEGNRVQRIKRTLFDLSYLTMNADGREHISEKMLVRKLEDRMESEGSVDVDARTDELKPLLDEGPDAIRERATDLAAELSEQAGDRTEELGDKFLDWLKGLIIADANVAPEEYELFELICEQLGVEKEMPEP